MVLGHPHQDLPAGTYVVIRLLCKVLKTPVFRHCHRDLMQSIRRARTLRRQSPGK